jgi:hypothetical protein
MAEPALLAPDPALREPDATDGRRVVQVALALCVLLAACIGLSLWLAHDLARHYARPPTMRLTALPATAGPPLEPDPAATLAQFRAQKAALLEGYGWVDRAHGVAHIPIDVAMRILAAQSAAASAARTGGRPR